MGGLRKVTPRCCAEYFLASPYPPASEQPQEAAGPHWGGIASTPAAEELVGGTEGRAENSVSMQALMESLEPQLRVTGQREMEWQGSE